MFDLRDLFRGRTRQERVDALGLRPDLALAAFMLVADERVDVQVTRLAPLLEPDESVLLLVEGRHQRQMGLLMLSTRRVMFRPHGEGAGSAPLIFALADLSDAGAETGSMTGRVLFRFADSALQIDRLLGKLADQIVVAARAHREAADRSTPASPNGQAPYDPLAELVAIRAEFAAGEVSAADYEVAKARLVRDI